LQRYTGVRAKGVTSDSSFYSPYRSISVLFPCNYNNIGRLKDKGGVISPVFQVRETCPFPYESTETGIHRRKEDMKGPLSLHMFRFKSLLKIGKEAVSHRKNLIDKFKKETQVFFNPAKAGCR
jgi:hypothetical protein